ncbi:MAG: YdcF family protein [Verrucomicrobiae bacterium]|nr:YdcF family protein [Verrucomicrobiae bacterium]
MIRRCIRRLPFLFAALAAVLAWPAYENAAGILSAENACCQAQAIIVLGGGTPERQIKAIELYKQGVAPLVISSGDGEPETAIYIYLYQGVPKNALLLETKSKSTWHNAKYTVPMLRERGITNVILVTSWFHSRRAQWTFQQTAPEISFHSCPTYWGVKRDLWKPCGLKRYVGMEFIKTPLYWLRGWLGL